jgi:hypothetical protein
MRNHSFPEISCIICSEPLDLSLDLSADENGKAVHQECYVNRLVAAPSHKTVIAKLFDFVSPVACLFGWIAPIAGGAADGMICG